MSAEIYTEARVIAPQPDAELTGASERVVTFVATALAVLVIASITVMFGL